MHISNTHHRQAQGRASAQRPRPKGARGEDYAVNDSYILAALAALGVFLITPLVIWLANIGL